MSTLAIFFLTHYGPTGGLILDDNYEPVLNGPEGVRTIEYLKEFLETGPVGMTGYSYGEMINAFVQGDAAFFLDASKVRKTAENPKKSKVVGKVGYALHPTIDGKCGSGTGGFVGPATLILFIGLIYPLVTTVQLALYDWGLGTPWDSKEFACEDLAMNSIERSSPGHTFFAAKQIITGLTAGAVKG